MIGSVEDWIIINTMVAGEIPHPIHVHLINYQVVARYTMRGMIIKYP
jgi:FtsP/CotA-like multicopper oxidase with cupredoxin domain